MSSNLRPVSAHAVQLQPQRPQRRVREASARDRARDSAHRYGGAAPRLEAGRQGSHPASFLPAVREPVVPRRGRQRFGGPEERRRLVGEPPPQRTPRILRTQRTHRWMRSRAESLKEAGAAAREPLADGGRTRWGDRAAALYTEAYAERYRAHDESIGQAHAVGRLSDWLHAVCDRSEERRVG